MINMVSIKRIFKWDFNSIGHHLLIVDLLISKDLISCIITLCFQFQITAVNIRSSRNSSLNYQREFGRSDCKERSRMFTCYLPRP